MDFKRKKLVKKRANVLSIMGYSFLLLFVIEMILIFSEILTQPNLVKHGISVPLWLILVVVLTPLFLCLIFQIYSILYTNELGMYRSSINEYRRRKMFIRILDLVRDKEYSTAIDLYDKLKNTTDNNYIYMHIVTTYLNSDDPKLVKKGNQWMYNLRKAYDYNEITKKLLK